MVAGGSPTVQILLDDGSGAFPYDITAYWRRIDGMNITRGRSDELSDVQPGTCDFVLDNSDGRFTLGSTTIASPSPIRVDNRIRVKFTANATTVNRYTGYLQAEPVSWPSGGDLFATVKVTLIDAQARAERRVLRSFVDEEIYADSPTFIYGMQEEAGVVSCADISGNQHPTLTIAGSGTNVAFGDTSAGWTGVKFSAGKYLTSTETFTPTTSDTVTYLVKFRTSTVPANSGGIFGSPVSSRPVPLSINGAVGGTLSSGVGGGADSLPTTVCDGADHVGAVVISGTDADLYLDGVLVDHIGGGVTAGPAWTVAFGESFTGVLSYAARYPTALSAARILTLSQALLTGFAGESGTARITRLAGYAGIPLGTLDTSLTNVAFIDIAGSAAASALRDVVDAELGVAYINGSGSLDFHNRNKVVAKTTPDITIDANLLDEGTQFQVDTQDLINYFETTAAGTSVTQVVRNTRSESGDGTVTYPGHGRYSQSKTYLVQTDGEALDRANWIVANHAEPAPRLGTLKVDLLTATAAQQASFLAAEADTWIRVTGLPSQTPGGTTADLIVQGFADANSTNEWSLGFNVVSQSLFSPVWVLGDSTYSVLGTTTRLYV